MSDAARQAGNSAEATAMMESAANAIALVVMLTGRPGNISGIFTSFSRLESPKATLHPTVPLTNASTQPSARKSIMMRSRVAPESFAQSDLARPFGNRDQHDVHDADAAKRQRYQADEARNTVIESKMPLVIFAFSTVSHTPTALLSAGSKLCDARDDAHHLFPRGFELIERCRLIKDLAQVAGIVLLGRRHIPRHRSVGQPDLLFVETRVAAVLFLVRHHADNPIREGIDRELPADDVGAIAESCFFTSTPITQTRSPFFSS